MVLLLLLSIISTFLSLGMILLPPLTGSNLGSVVTRAWLALGVLVFVGYYLSFLEQEKRIRWQKMFMQSKERSFAVLPGKRSTRYN